MIKTTKELNRHAGKKTLIECFLHYKQYGCKLIYLANHFGMLANVYDYIRVAHPEWHLENYLKKMIEHYYMKLNGFKDEQIKEAAKCSIAEELIKKLVEKRVLIEDL